MATEQRYFLTRKVKTLTEVENETYREKTRTNLNKFYVGHLSFFVTRYHCRSFDDIVLFFQPAFEEILRRFCRFKQTVFGPVEFFHLITRAI